MARFKRPRASVTRVPEERHGERWDRWCAELLAAGYPAWLVAERAGVSEARVRSAAERVRLGRYDG